MASVLVTGTSGCWSNTSGEVGTLSVGGQDGEGEIVVEDLVRRPWLFDDESGVRPAEDAQSSGISVVARE